MVRSRSYTVVDGLWVLSAPNFWVITTRRSAVMELYLSAAQAAEADRHESEIGFNVIYDHEPLSDAQGQ